MPATDHIFLLVLKTGQLLAIPRDEFKAGGRARTLLAGTASAPAILIGGSSDTLLSRVQSVNRNPSGLRAE